MDNRPWELPVEELDEAVATMWRESCRFDREIGRPATQIADAWPLWEDMPKGQMFLPRDGEGNIHLSLSVSPLRPDFGVFGPEAITRAWLWCQGQKVDRGELNELLEAHREQVNSLRNAGMLEDEP